jgi:hypothetical protein
MNRPGSITLRADCIEPAWLYGTCMAEVLSGLPLVFLTLTIHSHAPRIPRRWRARTLRTVQSELGDVVAVADTQA